MTTKARPSSEPDSGMTTQPEDPRMLVEPGDSETLTEVVGGSAATFFEDVWQRRIKVFRSGNFRAVGSSGRPDGAVWMGEESPLKALVSNGWPVLVDMLEQGRSRLDGGLANSTADMAPLIFQGQACLSQPNIYGCNLYMAYLDGCSIVLNHADTLNGYIARLCQDLQRSFPHAYANAYVTPPASKAVPPHADDRDVLVIQVVGQKHWKVYENVPIPFPYPPEQVGKEGLPIPPSVLAGPCLFDGVLNEGDVLYMPRGFVHEANTQDSDLSFHVTVALATHDWTLAGMMQNAATSILTRVVDYRMALPVQLGRGESEEDRTKLQSSIDEAIERLRREITAEAVCRNLGFKYNMHNRAKFGPRQAAMERMKASSTTQYYPSLVVGRQAAATVTLSTQLRCSTPAEKATLPPPSNPQGLHVREDAADAVLAILRRIKTETDLVCSVKDLAGLISPNAQSPLVCDRTLLSLGKCCVELGAVAIVRS